MHVSFYVFTFLALLFGRSFLRADYVELKDGRRIEGLILAENTDSIEIEVGKNETGTIRQILKIHSSEISSWVADKEGRVLADSGKEVNRLGGTEYIKRLLTDAVGEIEAGNYDRGIEQFGEAAELAIRNVDSLEPADRVEALEMRAHALRLQLAALEGKQESLEKRREGALENLEEARKKLERDIEEFKDDKEKFQEEREKDAIQLGNRHKQNDLTMHEEALVKRQLMLNEKSALLKKAMAESEAEQMKTATQIRVVEEQVDQAEDEAKAAERRSRKR